MRHSICEMVEAVSYGSRRRRPSQPFAAAGAAHSRTAHRAPRTAHRAPHRAPLHRSHFCWHAPPGGAHKQGCCGRPPPRHRASGEESTNKCCFLLRTRAVATMVEVSDTYHASLLARFGPKKKGKAAAKKPEEKVSVSPKEQHVKAKKAARAAEKEKTSRRIAAAKAKKDMKAAEVCLSLRRSPIPCPDSSIRTHSPPLYLSRRRVMRRRPASRS